jgi:hypothetical protein
MMCRESVRETLDNWKVQGDVIDRYVGGQASFKSHFGPKELHCIITFLVLHNINKKFTEQKILCWNSCFFGHVVFVFCFY